MLKMINLSALSQITQEDLYEFLSWLQQRTGAEISLAQMEKASPIRTSKLGSMFRIVKQFGFVSEFQSRLVMTSAGKDFSLASSSVRKAVLRIVFMRDELVQGIMSLLKASATGRVSRRVIKEYINTRGTDTHVSESELDGLIIWGRLCDLFQYDKKQGEIIRIEQGDPIAISKRAG